MLLTVAVAFKNLKFRVRLLKLVQVLFMAAKNLKFDFATLSNVTSLGEDAFNGCTSATGWRTSPS